MLPSLKEAINAIKAGDKKTGRALLADILQADLQNETAWLWMSSVVDTDREKRQCLARVLAINPDNQVAQRGLALLGDEPAAASAPPPRPDDDDIPLPPKMAAAVDPPAVPSAPAPALHPKPEPELADIPKPKEPPPQPPTAEPVPQEPPPDPEPEEPEPVVPDEEPDEDEAGDETEKTFWRTDRGRTVIAVGGVALFLLCAACCIAGLVFRPVLVQVPATADALLGTATPTATPTLPTPTDTPTSTSTPTATSTPTLTPSATSTPVVADTATPTPTLTRTPTPDRNVMPVLDVLAADTIQVNLNGNPVTVKYLSIEVPSPDAPFGPEALEINRLLVSGKSVRLERDVTNTDEAGNLLRYVYVGDTQINEELLRQGVARLALVPPDTKYGARLQEVEQAARLNKIGLWSLE